MVQQSGAGLSISANFGLTPACGGKGNNTISLYISAATRVALYMYSSGCGISEDGGASDNSRYGVIVIAAMILERLGAYRPPRW